MKFILLSVPGLLVCALHTFRHISLAKMPPLRLQDSAGLMSTCSVRLFYPSLRNNLELTFSIPKSACPRCGSPSKQVNTLVDYLSKNQTRFGRVWVDVEMKDDYWMTSTAANRVFFEGIIQTLAARRVSIGIYTSKSQWEPIMGSNYTRGAQYPLWYARYNNQINFNDFSAFAGWQRPYIKQYVGDVTVCGVDIDKNYMP
jgi:hypothetical protein